MANFKKTVATAKAKVTKAESLAFAARLEAIEAILQGAPPHDVLTLCVHAMRLHSYGSCHPKRLPPPTDTRELLRSPVGPPISARVTPSLRSMGITPLLRKGPKCDHCASADRDKSRSTTIGAFRGYGGGGPNPAVPASGQA
jgi:hypothetical protein